MLLQGPVGPFFKHLQDHLEGEGYDVWRVIFNPADRVFAGKRGGINFYGDATDWKKWFADFIEGAEVDHVILFGAERPAHRVAREIAMERGVDVLALEEGYVRPGYITAERGGNNARSPLAGRMPPEEMNYHEQPDFAAENFNGFKAMCRYGAVYYHVRAYFSYGKQKHLMHRPFQAVPEQLRWVRNMWRRLTWQARNFATIERLLEHHDGAYYLVPMQVSSDTQLASAARGWSTIKLASAALKSFARHAPEHARLVFKVHPLERGHCEVAPLIRDTAKAYGVLDRVDLVNCGSLGLLARHSAGMITINSTSGLSAIFHGVPLLVFGDAIYAHPKLARVARDVSDIDAFWREGHVADADLRKAYLKWIKSEALVVGDFYAPKGMRAACRSVYVKLREKKSAETMIFEARSAC